MSDTYNKTYIVPGKSTQVNTATIEDIEDYMDPYEDNIDLIFKELRKLRRRYKCNLTITHKRTRRRKF